MRAATLFALSALIFAAPALGQTVVDPENMEPEDVVMSPLSDVNLHKKKVPAVLEAALVDPYDLTGIKTCAGYTTAIESLDASLGDDIDIAREKSNDEKMGNSAGTIVKSVIGSFIPFRGILREISGANAQQRAWERALYAGSVRRAFLKGMGQSKGCAYPASPATPQILAMLDAQRDAALAAKKAKKDRPAERTAGAPVDVAFESNAVIQPVNATRR